ncbi:bifunctional homocysteine S-methyltransferase/methylenetetrahydrofolate reductase [bacterium]|nr:bifunctional homocysteine S-methyltransferase/methylenetetrahydrofolate reductase [bacterium]
MKSAFAAYLERHLVLADGAMGTLIYERGCFIDKCYDELNIINPDLIRRVHREYVEAGAAVLETNTFGANRLKLARHHLEDRVAEINRRGVELAKEAAGDGEQVFVAGSIGPLGVRIEPWGDLSLQEARDVFREQAEVLATAGADLFFIETFTDIREIEQAVNAVKDVSGLPVIAHMAVREDGKTLYGLDVEEVGERLSAMETDAVGLNCAIGPKPMLDFIERLAAVTNKPISVMPNAGMPQQIDGRTFYMTTPEYFGVYAKRFIEAGASIIGGCCGTTPDHIRKMAGALTQKQTRLKHRGGKVMVSAHTRPLPEPVPAAKKSALAAKIAAGKKVVLVEMVPPRGRVLEAQLEHARTLGSRGIDAINIPDGPRASARMNPLALALKLQENGVEPVLHYTCRDRNLLGMQSDLLGASALGVRNILAVTGDPPMIGDYPEATAVFDVDSIGLVNVISALNHGLDVGGRPIGAPTEYFIGVGVDPNSINPEKEYERFRWKVEAGAEFVITQPVFDAAALERFHDGAGDVAIPFIAGIWPLASLRNAEFMRNEVPGVTVPDAVMARMARFSRKEDQQKEGIEIAREMELRVRPFTAGIQVSAPFGRFTVAVDVARDLLDR